MIILILIASTYKSEYSVPSTEPNSSCGFGPQTNHMRQELFLPLFTGEKTKTQSHEIMCPKL